MNATNTYSSAPIPDPLVQPLVAKPGGPHNVALSYLKAFITVLVVAHHSLLAYHPYALPPSGSFSVPPMLWRVFPIVDSNRCPGADLFVGFNDIFFMALMFFLSGVFVYPTLARKGTGGFLRDRFLRLGLPFIVAAGLLAPLAYFPAYLQSGAKPSLSMFWNQWTNLGSWPAGPAWFIWELLAFDLVAAVVFKFSPGLAHGLAGFASRTGGYPIRFFLVLVCLSAVAYLPLALVFDPATWFVLGPFSAQTSRVAHYTVYFFTGIAVGAYGIDRGLLAAGGRLACRWPLWLLSSLAGFVFCIVMLLATVGAVTKGQSALGLKTMGNFGFVLCCASAGLSFLGFFVRYFQRPQSIFTSLSSNAYGIYLIHYAIVSWIQYGLLTSHISGAAKGSLVFVCSLALSWTLAALLRSIPGVGRIIQPATHSTPGTRPLQVRSTHIS